MSSQGSGRAPCTPSHWPETRNCLALLERENLVVPKFAEGGGGGGGGGGGEGDSPKNSARFSLNVLRHTHTLQAHGMGRSQKGFGKRNSCAEKRTTVSAVSGGEFA